MRALTLRMCVRYVMSRIGGSERNTFMHVLVLASQKGGAGKTTLSRHLAVEAERAGQGPVVLIDADPQGGLASWWNRRTAESPVFFASRMEDLPKHLDQARA